MYKFRYSRRFKRDFKKISRNPNFKPRELERVFGVLLGGGHLSTKYQNHKLMGEFEGCMECHVQSDILLIYSVDKEALIINLLRIGSHSDLF